MQEIKQVDGLKLNDGKNSQLRAPQKASLLDWRWIRVRTLDSGKLCILEVSIWSCNGMGPRGPHCLLYPQWYQISLGIKETNKSAVLVLGIWSGWKDGYCRGSGVVNPKTWNNRVGALTGALWVKGGQNPPQIPEQMSCLGKAVWYRAWRGQTSGGRTWEVRTLCSLSVWATMDLIHGPLVARTKR